MGKGRRSPETCLRRGRSLIPNSGIMLWLVKCLHVDRLAGLLTVSRSFNVTPLPLRSYQKRDKTPKSVYICKECMLRTATPCAPRRRKPQLYGDLEGSPLESIRLFFTGRRPRIFLCNVLISLCRSWCYSCCLFFFCSHRFALSPRSALLEQASVITVGGQS